MRRTLLACLAVLVCITGMGTLVLQAHEDDPKLLDRQPPYVGPAYRSSGPNPTPLAVGFDSLNVQLLAWLPLSEFGSPSSGNDCWGYTSPSGKEYGIFGHSDGTAFIDISTPGNPQIVANLSGPNSLWRDIKVFGPYAYAVSEGGGGIQVFNMTNIDSGTVTFVRNVGSSDTHNVAIDTTSGFLYRTGGVGNGLIMYNLNTNPTNPPQVGTWSSKYVHDAQVVTYTSGPYAGRQIAFCCGGDNGGFDNTALHIVDVTNKAAPFVVSITPYPGRQYCHQGWLSEDKQYFYMNDELDEDGSGTTTSRIFDVSDIDNPFFAGSFTSGSTSVDHNLYVKGNLIYEANYRSGLRVFDATNPTSPVEIGYFDTYPNDDGASFNGLWSNFPYFDSGVVIGSDLERGFFVWLPGLPQIEITAPNGTPDLVNETTTVTIRIEELDGNLVPGTAQLHYDDGSGQVDVDLVGIGGEFYDAEFGTTNCGSIVSWYVSAEADNGITYYFPSSAPNTPLQSVSGAANNLVLEDDIESNTGWSVGLPGDDATTGIWTRVNPIGTAAQPEDDHSNPGTLCWVTGQGSVGGSVGENDVDGGKTTLVSPTYDLSSDSNAVMSYWRWFSNDQGSAPNTDVFIVDISNNNGSSWVRVETIGPTGPDTNGGWIKHEFLVSDFVAPTQQVKMRFIAADEGDGSIVEAAIDDIEISSLICNDCNGNGIEDADDIISGFSSDDNGNGIPDECESAITDCGSGQINAGCGATSNVLLVNGQAGGGDRTVEVGTSTALTFSISEAPAMQGDAATSKAIVYMWFAIPGDSDVVNLPKQLGAMCFGPKLVETRPADFIWNSIGIANKAGAHNAPTAPPIIPDSGTLNFYDLPGGWGQTIDVTCQGFLPDDCTQGTKPFSVTNGFVLRVQ